MDCEHDWCYESTSSDCSLLGMGDINQWHPCYGASCPCEAHEITTTYKCRKCGEEMSESSGG